MPSSLGFRNRGVWRAVGINVDMVEPEDHPRGAWKGSQEGSEARTCSLSCSARGLPMGATATTATRVVSGMRRFCCLSRLLAAPPLAIKHGNWKLKNIAIFLALQEVKKRRTTSNSCRSGFDKKEKLEHWRKESSKDKVA